MKLLDEPTFHRALLAVMSPTTADRNSAPKMRIPFNVPYVNDTALNNLSRAITNRHLSGNGEFTKLCQAWLEENVGCERALLTHSATGALEMCALLANIASGDEVIMPSFTFATTASAFALHGGIPVFVDIRSDTLTLDEDAVEAAITNRTRAIVAVHYAGFSSDMTALQAIARKHSLILIEDAAQAIMSRYNSQALGSYGQLAALSFHETKNLQCGEGGALLVNDPAHCERAEIAWEKGTNRSAFFRGEVDKYSWVDLGSSFQMSEVSAALLYAQLQLAGEITSARLSCWNAYYRGFADLETAGRLRRPMWLPSSQANAHIFYLLLPNLEQRTALLRGLRGQGIDATFHYVPLHSSPAGKHYGRTHGSCETTDEIADRLVRLPLWHDIEPQIPTIIDTVRSLLR